MVNEFDWGKGLYEWERNLDEFYDKKYMENKKRAEEFDKRLKEVKEEFKDKTNFT